MGFGRSWSVGQTDIAAPDLMSVWLRSRGGCPPQLILQVRMLAPVCRRTSAADSAVGSAFEPRMPGMSPHTTSLYLQERVAWRCSRGDSRRGRPAHRHHGRGLQAALGRGMQAAAHVKPRRSTPQASIVACYPFLPSRPHPRLCRLARAPAASSSSMLPCPVTSSSGTCSVSKAG